MNLSKRILLVVMSVLIIANVSFIIKDIQTEVSTTRAIVQSAEAILNKTVSRLEEKINKLETKMEMDILSTSGRENLIEKNLNNLPNKMKETRIALEQKLRMINIRINNSTVGALGSGVSIKYKGKFYILSAGHMATVGGKDELAMWENNQKICDLEIVKHAYGTDEMKDGTNGDDLILFRSKDTNIQPRFYVDIDAQEPILGTEVYIVGNPMGIDDVVSVGRVIVYKNKYMYITDNIYFGNSGGGVYSLEGNLLGIVSHMQPIQPDITVPPYMIFGIVRMNVIREFMRGVE